VPGSPAPVRRRPQCPARGSSRSPRCHGQHQASSAEDLREANEDHLRTGQVGEAGPFFYAAAGDLRGAGREEKEGKETLDAPENDIQHIHCIHLSTTFLFFSIQQHCLSPFLDPARSPAGRGAGGYRVGLVGAGVSCTPSTIEPISRAQYRLQPAISEGVRWDQITSSPLPVKPSSVVSRYSSPEAIERMALATPAASSGTGKRRFM
jgi:hypothetical protein